MNAPGGILIVVASRYGSTSQAAEWIAERLRLAGLQVEVAAAEAAPAPAGRDAVILGSGIYAHHILEPLAVYIGSHLETLRGSRVALFGVSMSPKPVFTRGHAHGGLAHFDDLFSRLGPAVIHADMLGGQIAFAGLSPDDRRDMEAFYAMLGLAPAEIERRKAPRTLMKKKDYWSFAEEVLAKLPQMES